VASKNIKRLLGHLLYIVVFIAILVKAMEWERHFELITLSTYNSYLHMLFLSFFPVAMGVLLALPGFINKTRKPGSWKLDWVLLAAIGAPTLYTAIAPVLFFSPISKFLPITTQLFAYSLTPHIICGVVFGYVLLSCFDKEENNEFNIF